MSCCLGCCKNADELWDIGSNRLFALDSSKPILSTKDDVKELIGTLKILRKAAHQNHPAACYLFGATFGKCYRLPQQLNCSLKNQALFVKAFKGCLSEGEFDYSLLNRARPLHEGTLVISPFCYAVAYKYLCKAARLGSLDATPEIRAIESYKTLLQDRLIAMHVQQQIAIPKGYQTL